MLVGLGTFFPISMGNKGSLSRSRFVKVRGVKGGELFFNSIPSSDYFGTHFWVVGGGEEKEGKATCPLEYLISKKKSEKKTLKKMTQVS